MPTILSSVLVILGVLLLSAVVILIFRTFLYGRVPEQAEPAQGLEVQADRVAEHLAAILRIQTISTGEDHLADHRAFGRMHAALEKIYPRLHAALHREVINQHSLLYTWVGANPDLEPVLLCAHLDVVPADPATLAEWSHLPFAGDVADGHVWGRGALDMKSTLTSLCEAVEGLIKTGYKPERTLLLAFGHDEELGGVHGAREIAALLAERGVRLAAVGDEGGAIMNASIPGVQVPVALIGVAEKGYASLTLKVEGRPGHSSMPPRHTAIGVLARALARVEANPMPARLSMVRLMFDELGIFLPFSARLAFANTWLLGGALRKRLESSPTTNALIRTTAAATLIHGGVKDNVLPAEAAAVVNCRLLPGDQRIRVLEHYRKVIADEAVQVSLEDDHSWEASVVSPVDSPVYRGLARTIRQVFPEAAVAPFLVSGATDSRHYLGLTPNVFRFSPMAMDSKLLTTIHGIDERISVEALARMVMFYGELIRSWTASGG